MKTNVTFRSHNLTLAGVLYLPDDFMGGMLYELTLAQPYSGSDMTCRIVSLQSGEREPCRS